jgi:hypothetical protein
MRILSLLASLALPLAASAQPCELTYQAEQEPPGLFISGYSMPAAKLQTIWDPDGSGPLPPVLVMTGPPLNRVLSSLPRTLKSWDGIRWMEMPSPSDNVNAAVVYDGDLLIAGASPQMPGWTNGLYRYDGEDWHFIEPPAASSLDFTMLVKGSELFIVQAHPTQSLVSRAAWLWDGQTWTVLQQVPGSTTAAVIHDGELIVSTNSRNLFRWTGETWAMLPVLADGMWVSALASIGGILYAGTDAGTVYRLDGSNWVRVGLRIPMGYQPIFGITEYRGDLFVSTNYAGYSQILRLAGNDWVISAAADLLNSTPQPMLRSFMEYQGELYIAGAFASLNMGTGGMVARYDGERWKSLGMGADEEIRFLTTFQGNPIAGGRMLTMGGKQVRGIGVRVPGMGWTELGGGLSSGAQRPSANAAVEHQGRLYVGGSFWKAGDIVSPHIAAWDGAQWHAVGGIIGVVNALDIYGGDIVATGYLNALGHIARWDGIAWQPLGQGIGGVGDAVLVVGQDLYAAFTTYTPAPPSQIPHGHVARWDGSSWSPVGETFNNRVDTLGQHNGTVLAAGTFTACGSIRIQRFARLDGDQWQPVAHPFAGVSVRTMRPWRNQLLMGGRFLRSAGIGTFVATWDGESWMEVSSPTTTDGSLNAVLPDGDDLILGGAFMRIGTQWASRMATLSCTPWCYANCDGPSSPLNLEDFTCFLNQFALASALPHAQQLTHYANCDASTTAPILNIDDFTCFINRFAQGCP